jgi:predicted secreted protein
VAIDEAAVGSGGVETWSFVASQSGRQELRFEYRPPWETTSPPARALTYTITVR